MLNRNQSDGGGAAAEHAQQERGVRLLHRARDLRGLTPQQVRRIASRLDAAVAPGRRRFLLPALAALALLLSAGTAVAWGTGTLRRLPVVRALFASKRIPAPVPSPARAGATSRPSELATPVAANEPAPFAEADGMEPARPPRREDSLAVPPARKRASVAPALAARQQPALPAPIPDSPIVREGESFANVLRRWRRDRDARAALSALDLHDRGFANGQMALESRLLRVEILLSGGHDREALPLLEGLALGKGNVPRGRELLTVRGELRIRAGRCDDGRADLVSIAAGTDAFAERARSALTYCR